MGEYIVGVTWCSLCKQKTGVYYVVKIKNGTASVHLCTFCTKDIADQTQ